MPGSGPQSVGRPYGGAHTPCTLSHGWSSPAMQGQESSRSLRPPVTRLETHVRPRRRSQGRAPAMSSPARATRAPRPVFGDVRESWVLSFPAWPNPTNTNVVLAIWSGSSVLPYLAIRQACETVDPVVKCGTCRKSDALAATQSALTARRRHILPSTCDNALILSHNEGRAT